jgi:tRNA dimethylallyltransferase
MAADTLTPLVVIVGPTASGKTRLAIEISQQYNGEIICADSRTIYKGMDIGTAKPTLSEQKQVPHWGLDLVSPGERFTAADFKHYANQKITEIRGRGHVPILVGGTGLYVDAVVFDYGFGTPVDQDLRDLLGGMSLDQLHEYAQKQGITLPENEKNIRYVIRTIEQVNRLPTRQLTPTEHTIIVTDKVLLRTRIEQRTEQLFKNGIVAEATMLGEKYGWESEAMTSNIYPLIHQYLNGTMTLDEVRTKNNTADWRLAKRQLTWLRRNEFVQWLALDDAKKYIIGTLAK